MTIIYALVVGLVSLVAAAPAHAQLVIATSTLETFLADIFGQSIGTMLYTLAEIWPYLLTAFVLYIFYRVGKFLFS